MTPMCGRAWVVGRRRTAVHTTGERLPGPVHHSTLIVCRHACAAGPRSAQGAHPAGDSAPDLVRRILLEVVQPGHRYLGLRWQRTSEVEIRDASEDRTWVAPHPQFGHIAAR